MRIMHMSRAARILRHFLIPVMTRQKKLGHYVCICTSDTPDANYLHDAGFEVFGHGLKRSLNPYRLLKSILKIKRILLEQRIEVIICHNALGGIVGRSAAWLAKTPRIIYFVHGLACAPSQNPFSWWSKYLTEKLLGYVTDAALVMNDYDENLCRTHHIIKDTNKTFRIPGMGVDLTRYNTNSTKEAKQTLSKELSISKNQNIILCVARLIPEKGVFVLLESARRICAQRNDVYFLLVGSGPSRNKLRKLVKANHMENNFKLLGWRDDIPRIMKASDIFVLPTYFMEGLPVSILEAMACGKPVIATKHRGCEDTVENGRTGLLVPVKQATILSDKISFLLGNKLLQTQMGKAGRKLVEQHFEFNYCTGRIVEVLEEAIH